MKKANPKTVGGFVVGAVALGLGAVIVFGSGRFFEERKTVVSFFTDSLQGLQIGAPVEFRGVQLGTVTDIFVQVDPETLEFLIPVVYEVNPSRIHGAEAATDEEGGRLDELIDKGLRAQLVSKSFVTGQQSIQLDFNKGAAVTLVETDLSYDQIPTIPSPMAEIKQSMEEVLGEITGLLRQVTAVFSDDNRQAIGETLENVEQFTEHLSEVITELRTAVQDVSRITATIESEKQNIAALFDNANATLVAYKDLAEGANGLISENSEGIGKAISGLRAVEGKFAKLADAVATLVAENRTGFRDFSNDGLYEIRNLAVDAQAAMEQIRRVMEEMERDPARFFLGRPGRVEVQ